MAFLFLASLFLTTANCLHLCSNIYEGCKILHPSNIYKRCNVNITSLIMNVKCMHRIKYAGAWNTHAVSKTKKIPGNLSYHDGKIMICCRCASKLHPLQMHVRLPKHDSNKNVALTFALMQSPLQ